MPVNTADPDLLRRLSASLEGAVDSAVATARAAAHLASDVTPVVTLDPVHRWGIAWTASLADRARILEQMDAPRCVTSGTGAFTEPGEALDHVFNTAVAVEWEDFDGAVENAEAAFDMLRMYGPASIAVAWLASLDPAVAEAIVRRRPAIADIPGMPLGLIFAANRRRIELELERLDDAVRFARGEEREALLREKEFLEGLLPRNFVVFEWKADGIIAEWIGPLDAETVMTLIPGMTTDKFSADAMHADAQSILRADGTGDLAVVTALAYDAPDGPDAALPKAAEEGWEGLVDLVDKLPIDDRRLVLSAHSYGSFLLGRALVNGLAAELPDEYAIILNGSPGTGVDHVSELGVDPERVFVLDATSDIVTRGREHLPLAGAVLTTAAVALVPVWLPVAVVVAAAAVALAPITVHIDRTFGTLPSDPSFGARVLDAGDGGHSSYLEPEIVVGFDDTYYRAFEKTSQPLESIISVAQMPAAASAVDD